MNTLKALEYLSRNGVALLREIIEVDKFHLAGLGIPLDRARGYVRAAEGFLGHADSPRLQQKTVAQAVRMEHSIDHLAMINRHARKLKTRGAAWRLRAELVAMPGSYEEVNRAGLDRVQSINGASSRTPGIRISRAKDGMRTMTITDEQRRLTDFEKTLDAVIKDHNIDGERRQSLLKGLWTLLESDGGTLTPAYQTVIAIGLKDSMKILRGEGDDVVIGLSDGTTMTGAELASAAIAGELGSNTLAGLSHPTSGPVNLYEARFASYKQRILAKAENLVCPWPGCNVPADRCQIHHIHAHSDGGQTEPSNLTTLCAYHNGVNDDDPRRRRKKRRKKPNGPRPRGRVDRHRGKVRYQSPSGKLIDNDHTNIRLGAMNLI